MAAGFVASVALGLWISFQYTRAAWEPDADIFVTVALWEGVREHGRAFLTSWNYTQDNWLLSLIPIASAVFALFGATPEATLGLGWGFFLASVSFSAWITVMVAGRAAGLATGAILLFASYAALGPAGYLSYPISHNISMAWGTGALALAVLALKRDAPVLGLAAALAVFVANFSDPWAGAAVAAPMSLAAITLVWLRPSQQRCSAIIAAGCIVAFVCARTRVFGLFDFLPQTRFVLNDLAGMRVNLDWAAHSLANLSHIAPGADAAQPAVRALNLSAFAAILTGSAISVAVTWRRMRIEQQFVAAFAILSIGAILALFVIGTWDLGPTIGRFFPNLYYLPAILVALQFSLGWRIWPRWARAGVLIYASLFVVAVPQAGRPCGLASLRLPACLAPRP